MLGVFLDTETNGLNASIHKLLEIAYVLIDLETGEEKARYQAVVHQSAAVWATSDPESLKITAFRWEEVERGEDASEIARVITEMFKRHNIQRKKAVFICQNPSFDRVFFGQLIDANAQEALRWPYHWLDLASMYWALAMDGAKLRGELLPWKTGFSKDSIAKRYKLAPERKPHRAMNGVEHLVLCYTAVVGFPKLHHHNSGSGLITQARGGKGLGPFS